jgi:hypothetical protein
MEWLNALAEQGFKVRLCGHSLGAGTAAMISFLLRYTGINPKCKLYDSPGSLQVYAYSIPSIVSETIADSPLSISPSAPAALSPIFNVSLGDDAVPRMNTRNGLAVMLQLKALMGNYDVVKTKDTSKRPLWLAQMMGTFDHLKRTMPGKLKHFAVLQPVYRSRRRCCCSSPFGGSSCSTRSPERAASNSFSLRRAVNVYLMRGGDFYKSRATARRLWRIAQMDGTQPQP